MTVDGRTRQCLIWINYNVRNIATKGSHRTVPQPPAGVALFSMLCSYTTSTPQVSNRRLPRIRTVWFQEHVRVDFEPICKDCLGPQGRLVCMQFCNMGMRQAIEIRKYCTIWTCRSCPDEHSCRSRRRCPERSLQIADQLTTPDER